MLYALRIYVHTILKQAKAAEAKLRERMGQQFWSVIHSIEQVLKANRMEQPFYHSGKYSGKAMNHLMTNSNKIMEEIAQVVLELPENGRCNNAEVTSVTEGYAVVLHILMLFSLLLGYHQTQYQRYKLLT
jgi:hypothetical protein